VVTWGSSAERLSGWKAEEIIGQHISRFYQPEGRTIVVGMRPAVAITTTQIGLAFGTTETALTVDRALDRVASQLSMVSGFAQ
jgi:hypothetical protein